MWDRLRRICDCRPLACAAGCFVLGVVAGNCTSVPWAICAAAFSLLAGLALLVRRRPLALGAAFALGLLLITRALCVPDYPLGAGQALSGRVASLPERTDSGLRVTLDRVSINGQRIAGKVSLSVYGSARLDDYEPDSLITGTVRTYRASEAHNPHAFSYRDYLWRQGIGLCASGKGEALSSQPARSPSLRARLLALRERIGRQIDRLYADPIAGVVRALVLGDREQLDEQIQDAFRTSGIAHLLALSGLHLAILAAGIHFLLSRFRLPHALCFSATMLLLCAYAVLVGSPASVLRAALLYGLLALARLTSRPYDALTALLAALALLLAVNPLWVEDAGLILSFSSVGGILCFQRMLKRPVRRRSPARRPALERARFRMLRSLREATSVSLSAQLGSLPAIACSFHEVNLLSLAMNLFAVPLVSLALPAALLSVPLSFAFPTAARALALPVGWLLRLVTALSAQFAALSWATVRCASWPAGLLILYAACALLASPYLLRALNARRAMLCLLPGLFLCACLLPRFQHTTGLEVQFVDVGQGDGAVLFCEGEVCLMDVGEYGEMADYLEAIGKPPGRVFLSHPHSDHCAGLAELIERFPPAELCVSDSFFNCLDRDVEVEALLTHAQEVGWQVRELAEGETLALSPGVTATVIQAERAPLDKGNELSLVLEVRYAGRSILFTGDLGLRYEQDAYPDCDVLKVAHHGSKYSTGDRLLSGAQPEIAVISVGYNPYGHPSEEAMDRLRQAGAQILRTDQCGLITVSVSPEGALSISTYLEDETK